MKCCLITGLEGGVFGMGSCCIIDFVGLVLGFVVIINWKDFIVVKCFIMIANVVVLF
jgi:hypothetical protein